MKGFHNIGIKIYCLIVLSGMCYSQKNIQPTKQNTDIIPTKIACEKTQYTSLYTRCQINFDFCNATKFTFLSCYKKQCERYIRASECRLWNKMELPEIQCYRQCCGTNQFSEKTCSQYNKDKQQTSSSINGVIIAIIVVSIIILVGVAAFLLIKVQKCCQKIETQKISKYNIHWRSQKVPDSTCQICKNYGALIQTPCKHYFHASCFEQNSKQDYVPLCPTCQSPIKQRLKIACIGCKQAVFKIKLWKIQHLQEILREGNAIHSDICSLKTKSDEFLLSPIKL